MIINAKYHGPTNRRGSIVVATHGKRGEPGYMRASVNFQPQTSAEEAKANARVHSFSAEPYDRAVAALLAKMADEDFYIGDDSDIVYRACNSEQDYDYLVARRGNIVGTVSDLAEEGRES